MTEVPEHLLKRAQAAKEKAAAKAAEGSDAPARCWARRQAAPAAAGDSRIPSHLLERSQAAKARKKAGGAAAAAGGGVAVAGSGGGVATLAPPPARYRARGTHPATPDRRQVRFHPGRQGQATGQGPRVATPPDRRVRRRVVHHGVHPPSSRSS